MQAVKGKRLGGSAKHQKKILANLAVSLIRNESIKTTHTKAKLLQPYVEKLVSYGKKGDLASRRKAISLIGNKGAVHKLFAAIAPGFKDRNGGYTRVIKLGFRKGDAADISVIAFVEKGQAAKDVKDAKKTDISSKKISEKAQDATEDKNKPAKDDTVENKSNDVAVEPNPKEENK